MATGLRVLQGIDVLPPELLTAIFRCLTDEPTDLVRCMLCCKAWHGIAQETLYQHVVLDAHNLPLFTRRLPSTAQTDRQIQSLTIRIDRVECESIPRVVHQGKAALVELARRVPQMGKLRSLSMSWPAQSGSYTSRFDLFPSVESILQKLPKSCIAVDLDIRAYLYPDGEAIHLCPTIRNLLPQLQYLRLRLPLICEDLLIETLNSQCANCSHPGSSPFTNVPALRSMSIHMGDADNRSKRCVGCLSEAGRGLISKPLTSQLAKFAASGHAPNLKTLQTFGEALEGCPGFTPSKTELRHDVLRHNTCAMPVRSVSSYTRPHWLIRQCNGEDYVTPNRPDIADILDHSWQRTEDGVSLPASLMACYGLTPWLPVVNRAEVKLQCTLWDEEAKTGRRLVEAQYCKFLEEHIPLEETPEGWIREGRHRSGSLRKLEVVK